MALPGYCEDEASLILGAYIGEFAFAKFSSCCRIIAAKEENMGVNSIDAEDDQFAYRYDTQLLIDRRDEDLDEDEIADYITEHFEGNSLIAAGDEDLIKIHFHTNEPWKILEYCNTIGEIYDIVVEDMIRQTNGLQG